MVWNRKILDKLLHRKYGPDAHYQNKHDKTRLYAACEDFRLENWSDYWTIEEMKLILIKRMLYADYELVSNQFEKVERKSGLKCELCQHQNICKVYKVLFRKGKSFDRKEISVGYECFRVLKNLIRSAEKVESPQNQNTNAL